MEKNKFIKMIEVCRKKLFIIVLYKVCLPTIIGLLLAACAGLATMYLIEPVEPMYGSTVQIYFDSNQEKEEHKLEDGYIDAYLRDDEMLHQEGKPILNQVLHLNPFTPNIRRNMVISGLIGWLFTTCFVVVNYLINHSNNSISDIEMIEK